MITGAAGFIGFHLVNKLIARDDEVVHELQDFSTQVDIYDPWVDAAEVEHECGVNILLNENLSKFPDHGAIILPISYGQFADLSLRQNTSQIILEVKGILNDADARL